MADPTFNPIEIINSVNTFYSQAWNNLLYIITGGVALIGIVIPLLVQWWQKRLLSINELEVEKRLTESFNVKYKELEDSIKAEIKLVTEKVRNSIEEEIATGKGGLFLLQGNICGAEENYSSAFESFITAISFLITGKDELNLRTALNSSKVSYDKIKDKSKISKCINTLKESHKLLKNFNENSRYDKELNTLDQMLKEIPK